MTVRTRAATPDDAEACGRIMFEAFRDVAARHGFPPDFPSAEAAGELARALIANPSVFSVVAEADGEVVGSNFLKEGDEIKGVGPITVDPARQGKGVGRQLMQTVLARANGAAGVRLLQDGFNMQTIGLYASLGFEVREPVLVMSGKPAGPAPVAARVRPMRQEDVAGCDRLCREVLGISRQNELQEALRSPAPTVAERDGRVTAYLTAPGFWLANHGVARSLEDMQALILGAAELLPSVSFLLPTRQASLFAWCLEHGMRAVKPMTLMTIGSYRETGGPYMPSVFY